MHLLYNNNRLHRHIVWAPCGICKPYHIDQLVLRKGYEIIQVNILCFLLIWRKSFHLKCLFGLGFFFLFQVITYRNRVTVFCKSSLRNRRKTCRLLEFRVQILKTMPDFCEMLPNVTPHNPCRVRGGGGDPVSLRSGFLTTAPPTIYDDFCSL